MSTQTQQPAAAAAKPAVSSLGQLVVARKNDIAGMQAEFARSLPPSIPADKFVRTVQTAITMNPQIAECNKQSVLNACMKAASDGLILDGREAALTVYNVNKGTKENPKWEKEAQYQPMVTGIIKRVRNSGEVTRFNAFVVHKNDLFKVKFGIEMEITHEPNFDNPGEVIGAYAACRFKDGLDDFEYMSKGEIESIRTRSKSPTKGPWVTDWPEMAKKTVMRRLSKRLPMSSDLRNVVQRIDETISFEPPAGAAAPSETIDHDTGEILTPEKPKRTYSKRSGAAAAKMAEAQANGGEQQPTPTPQANTVQQPANAAQSNGQARLQESQPQDAEYEEVDEGQQAGNYGDGDTTEDLI